LSKEILSVVLINNEPEVNLYKFFGGYAVENKFHENEIINPIYLKEIIRKLNSENIKCLNQELKINDFK
jgi:hypothetical protein